METRLLASENHFFSPCPFQGTSSGRGKKRFWQTRMDLFQGVAFFGSESHFPNEFSSPIIDLFKPKASESGHMLGIYVNLIFFVLPFLPENQTKGHINTKCQCPPFYTTSARFFEAPLAIGFSCTMAEWSIRSTSEQRDAVKFASLAMTNIEKETVTI